MAGFGRPWVTMALIKCRTPPPQQAGYLTWKCSNQQSQEDTLLFTTWVISCLPLLTFPCLCCTCWVLSMSYCLLWSTVCCYFVKLSVLYVFYLSQLCNVFIITVGFSFYSHFCWHFYCPVWHQGAISKDSLQTTWDQRSHPCAGHHVLYPWGQIESVELSITSQPDTKFCNEPLVFGVQSLWFAWLVGEGKFFSSLPLVCDDLISEREVTRQPTAFRHGNLSWHKCHWLYSGLPQHVLGVCRALCCLLDNQLFLETEEQDTSSSTPRCSVFSSHQRLYAVFYWSICPFHPETSAEISGFASINTVQCTVCDLSSVSSLWNCSTIAPKDIPSHGVFHYAV